MFDLLVSAAAHTMRDVMPVALVIGAFQAFVLRQRPAHFRRIIVGTFFLVLGLILFRFGITESLLPIGSLMAAQLSGPDFVGNNPAWSSYGWLYAFAFAVGLSATLAGCYAHGGSAWLSPWGLRSACSSERSESSLACLCHMFLQDL